MICIFIIYLDYVYLKYLKHKVGKKMCITFNGLDQGWATGGPRAFFIWPLKISSLVTLSCPSLDYRIDYSMTNDKTQQ